MIKTLKLLIPLSMLMSGLALTSPAMAQNENPFGGSYDPDLFGDSNGNRGIGSYKTLNDQCENFSNHGRVVCDAIGTVQNDNRTKYKPADEPPRVADLVQIETLSGSAPGVVSGSGSTDTTTGGGEDFFNPFQPSVD